MKKIIFQILFVFLSFLLQSTVFQAISFAGIVPNLLLVVTASYGFMYGEKDGIWTGFAAGLLMDIFYANFIGLYALLYMMIGFLNGKFAGNYYPEYIKLPMSLITGSDLLLSMCCYVFLYLLRGRFHLSYYFVSIMLPEMVYTVLVTLILYPLILLANGNLRITKKRSGSDFV